MNKAIWVEDVLNNLIHGRPLCNLCLTRIQDTDTFNTYYDDVVINYNGTEMNYQMSEIIQFIITDKMNASTSISDLVCHACVTLSMRSFYFLKMCNEKSKTIQNIVNSLSNLIQCSKSFNFYEEAKVNNHKLLLLTTNTTNSNAFTCNKHIFLKSAVSKKRILNKIMTYENNRHYTFQDGHSKIDVNSKVIELSQFKTTKKEVDSDLPITDMMYDVNDTVNFKCKICHQNTKTPSRLKKHFAKFHATKIFQCTDCGKKFGSLDQLKQHKSKYHRIVPVCSKCGKLYKNMSALKRHEENHKSKIICASCGKSYKNKHTYNDHVKQNLCQKQRRSNSEAKFICDYCSKKYSYKAALRVHIRFDHGDGKHHICEWCKKKFYSKSALNCHIVKHTKDKNFSCEVCGGRFVTKTSLLYHTRIHTGETPYSCQICDSRFLSASRRSDHIRRHHLPPSLPCGLCSKMFRNYSSLNKHKKLHNNPSSKHYISKDNS